MENGFRHIPATLFKGYLGMMNITIQASTAGRGIHGIYAGSGSTELAPAFRDRGLGSGASYLRLRVGFRVYCSRIGAEG